MSTVAQITQERHGDLVVARVVGEVDASNAGQVGERLRATLTNRSDVLLVDLTGVGYIDSAGLSVLFALASELRVHQQVLHLVVEPGSSVARVSAISGLDALVTTHGSLLAALREHGG